MSDTVRIAVSKTAWTDITNGIKRGLITNNSHHSIRYREALAQPSANDTFGHELHPQANRYFDLSDNFKLWGLGFQDDAAVALTKEHGGGVLTNALVEFKNGPGIDPSGRLRVSEPFGVIENKNITNRNRNQWSEKLSGVILEYDTLVGGPFTVAEEIRGTGGLLPIGTINTDNGASSMNIDGNHNDFTVGMTITGQTSGATAVLTSTNTGSDIQHNYNHAGVDLTVGTGATDFAIRETFRRAAYVPFKSQYPSLTFTMPATKTNVVYRSGLYNTTDGLFVEVTENDVAFVIRSSTSGTPVDTRFPQSEWNIDRFDGGVSGGPNPSGLTLDMTKAQLFVCPFVWQGVGPVFFGWDVGNKIQYAHQVETANISTVAYMRAPSLPLRYEIFNTGVTASPTTMTEICSTVSSEGGFTLPGLEFSASLGITPRTVGNTLTPILAVRLKTEFPTGVGNVRMAKFLKAAIATETNDVYIEIQHHHAPADITGTWNDVSGGSAVEFSTDITAITGRPAHRIDADYVATAAGNKTRSQSISGDFINLHSFISQDIDSTNSEVFVIYAQAFTGNADVRAAITWIEFD